MKELVKQAWKNALINGGDIRYLDENGILTAQSGNKKVTILPVICNDSQHLQVIFSSKDGNIVNHHNLMVTPETMINLLAAITAYVEYCKGTLKDSEVKK